ncbi:hypothetical protein [uncultured Methylobacterium sp.]|uniref:hypothetical protein n=1 Tax=uncultured Methylobacterium sp. TaxID=157278 RepID=UPI0035CB909A
MSSTVAAPRWHYRIGSWRDPAGTPLLSLIAPMAEDRNDPEAWIERAVAQACALRETVRDQPDLRELVDVILLDLGTRVGPHSTPSTTEI